MPLTEKQLDALTKLSELEESVGRLYEVYAGLFPDYKEFWLSLVGEEKQHARWIHELHSYVVQGSATFNDDRFNVVAIRAFVKYLNDELGKATMRERSLLNALSISQYIEESLIEQKYFEIVIGDSPKLKQILTSLATDTQNHIKKVREALNTYKKIS